MSDDPKNRGPAEGSRVSHDEEVRYWTQRLEVTAKQLLDAVRRAGASPTALQAYFDTTKASDSVFKSGAAHSSSRT